MKITIKPIVSMPKTCKPKYQPYSPMRMTLTPRVGAGYGTTTVQLGGAICLGRYTVHVPITSNGKLLSNAAGSFTVVK